MINLRSLDSASRSQSSFDAPSSFDLPRIQFSGGVFGNMGEPLEFDVDQDGDVDGGEAVNFRGFMLDGNHGSDAHRV